MLISHSSSYQWKNNGLKIVLISDNDSREPVDSAG